MGRVSVLRNGLPRENRALYAKLTAQARGQCGQLTRRTQSHPSILKIRARLCHALPLLLYSPQLPKNALRLRASEMAIPLELLGTSLARRCVKATAGRHIYCLTNRSYGGSDSLPQRRARVRLRLGLVPWPFPKNRTRKTVGVPWAATRRCP